MSFFVTWVIFWFVIKYTGWPRKKNPICMGPKKNTPIINRFFFFWAHEFWPNLSKFMGPNKKNTEQNYRAVCSATPPPVPPTGRPSVLPKFFVLVLNISSALLYYKKEIKLARTSIQKTTTERYRLPIII